jgi:hypothetical protein
MVMITKIAVPVNYTAKLHRYIFMTCNAVGYINPTFLCGSSCAQIISYGKIHQAQCHIQKKRGSAKKARKLLGALQKHYPPSPC